MSSYSGGRSLRGTFVCLGLVLAAAWFVCLSLPSAPAQAATAAPVASPAAPATAAAHAFTSSDRLVMTYLFYWYDTQSGLHITNGDGSDALTDHPDTMEGFSLYDPAWWRKQFTDMTGAGIDMALPVYWGSDSEAGWSREGLDVMTDALDSMTRAGQPAPGVGMFYDTSALMQQNGGKNPDLRTAGGRELFYSMIHEFFSHIPQRHWATIDGKAVVTLYTAAFTSGHDQKTFDYAREHFRADFGRDLFIIKEVSWANAEADDVCAWGAALAGPSYHGVTAIGPGYDDSAVPGRTTPKRPRDNGAFYESAWKKALARPANRLVIETWNEFHEGTDIAPSAEAGRKYVDLTAKYAALSKARQTLPADPTPFGGAATVRIDFGDPDKAGGLERVENADGLTAAVEQAGRPGRHGVPGVGGMYLYIGVDDDWLSYADTDVEATLEYLDMGKSPITIQYDSTNAKATLGGAYTDSRQIPMKGTGTWKSATVVLKHAKFAGRENSGADMRVALPNTQVVIGSLVLAKPKP